MPEGDVKTGSKQAAYVWSLNLPKKIWTNGPLKGGRVKSMEDAQRQIDNFMRKKHG